MFSSLGIYFIFSLSEYRSLNIRLEISLLDCFSNLNSSTSVSNLSFAFSKSLNELFFKISLICSSCKFKSVCLDSRSLKLACHSFKVRSYLSSLKILFLNLKSYSLFEAACFKTNFINEIKQNENYFLNILQKL